MPIEKEAAARTKQMHISDKALMLLPKRTIWNRETIQAVLRTSSLALSISVAILLINMFLFPLVGVREPYILFFPAVAFISWYIGYRSGIVMTVFTALMINYFLLRPQGEFIHPPSEMLPWVLYIFSALIMNYFIERSKHPEIVKQFEARQKEYQQLLLTLHRDYIQAKEEVRARDEFLSIASHELKTPLSAMLLEIQTVLHSVRNVSLANFSVENLLKMLESAEQQSKRLSKMINDLLNVSLITTGRMELTKEPMNLTETVKGCVENYREKAEKEGSTITYHGKESIKGNWDKLRVEQAITNLLTNAIKYGAGKPIIVNVTREGNDACLSVKDHGIGIPDSKREKIFARFERAVAKRSFEGLGVGLYITKQIVDAHGGTIDLQSKEGKGSEFIISLPIKS